MCRVTSAPSAICPNPGAIYLNSHRGTALTSGDGVTWTALPALGTNDLLSLTYGSQFVTVGKAGVIYTSLDGLNWINATSGVGFDLDVQREAACAEPR